MKEIQDNLVGTLIAVPLVFIGWCCLSFLWGGYIPDGVYWSVTLIPASCVSIFVWLILSNRKAVRNRVYLNVKPNVIEIEGSEHFCGEFSSDSRFLISTEAFQKTLVAVVLRESYTRGRFMFAREAAYVRIWPGTIGITDLEIQAIYKALVEEFIELEVEVVEETDRHHPHASAVKA